ncbi:hypothetical protein F8S09_05140 [Deinococcus sp. SDU3-2]|uniref:Outer membrane protein beta-barrel domain-containing protein n=1 Tax=Deinococcus terrestris TaxID=2651870 RepID=A0A7X1NUI6_9DEIO|nr:hypothetical protein [Deinococcus terrestris]MPY66082.1 hypothetical protein [Deinococcus terrestris]
MKQLLALTAAAALATAGAQTTTTTVNAIPATPISTGLSGVELGLTGGYAGGLSGEVFLHVPNVAGPFGVKAGVSFSRLDLLDDNAALVTLGEDDAITLGEFKDIFDATESGSATIFSLDGTYALGQVAPGVNSLVYAGGRYGLFRGALSYEGESTTYSSNNFGIGAGVMASYAIGSNLSLVGDLGIDQFFGSAVNVRQSSGADTDAGAAEGIYRQPGTVFKARIGIKTGF